MSALLWLVGLLSVLFYLIKYYFGRKKNFWKDRGVKERSYNGSIIKTFSGKEAPVDFDFEFYKELGEERFGGAFELGEPILIVKDLELVKHVLVKDFEHFVDHRSFAGSDPLFSQSLFFLHGQEWKDMRSILSPTFTSGKLRRMFHHFIDSSHKLRAYIDKYGTPENNGTSVNVMDVVGRYTASVIGAVAFGMETDCLTNSNSHFYKLAKKSADFATPYRLMIFALLTFFPKVGDFFKIQAVPKDCSNYFGTILRQALRDRESGKVKREDFLQLMIEAKQEAESKSDYKNQLREDIAIQQAFIFFNAGFDTVANLLGQALYILAAKEDIQDKLYSEIEQAMEDTNGEITYEVVNRLEYMEMFISETLRMYLPVSRLERQCVKDYKIPGTNIVIPKGMVVGIPAEGIHYDEKYYENSTEFNPERFSNENKDKRNPITYLPFGSGPRNCIGMRYALVEAKVALSYFLHNFIVKPTSGKTPIPIKMWRSFGTTRVPKDLQVLLTPRH